MTTRSKDNKTFEFSRVPPEKRVRDVSFQFGGQVHRRTFASNDKRVCIFTAPKNRGIKYLLIICSGHTREGATTLSITTFNITTLNITTLSIMTFCISIINNSA